MKTLIRILALIYILILIIPGEIKGSKNDYTEVLFKMKEHIEKIETYQCIFEAFSSREEETKNVTFRYFFKSPKFVRMEILEGKHKGAILLYKPHKVRVKLKKGILSIFSFSFKPEHKYVTDLRGYGMHQSDWGWYVDQHLKMLEFSEAKFSRKEIVERRNTEVYVIISKEPKKTRSVAKETLWIDSKEFIPVKYVQQDKSGKIILSALYKDIILNLDLDDKLFMKFKKGKRNPQLSFSF